jgi:hypothetical protein
MPPILVVCDYHNDSDRTSLEQVSSEGFQFMTRPQLITNEAFNLDNYRDTGAWISRSILFKIILVWNTGTMTAEA